MKAVLVVVVLSWGLSGWGSEGPSSGGGGMVVTCRAADGSIQSTELLDVYEAKVKTPGKVLSASGDMAEDYVRLVVNTFALQGYSFEQTGKSPEESERNARAIMDIVDWSGPLPFLNDQGEYEALPQGCQLEQLAIFSDLTGRVRVDSEIWGRLDSLSKAALLQHEIFYQYERTQRELTSESTRSLIRQQLAPTGYVPVKSGSANASLECMAESLVYETGSSSTYAVTRFYVIPSSEPGNETTTLQFTSFAGRPLLVKTTIELPIDFKVREFRKREDFFPLLYPASLDVRKIFQIPVKSEHRSDWEVKFEYDGSKPVSLSLIQDGVVQSKSVLSSCSNEFTF